MVDKHWTEKLAEKVFDSGYNYAIMRRTPNFVGVSDKPKMVGFNKILEFYDKIQEMSCVQYERVRLALRPGPNKHSYTVMYYPEGAMHRVVGYLFEKPCDYKPLDKPDLSQAGIIKI